MKTKKFFAAVGKAILYFLAYLGGQILVSVAVGFVLGVIAMLGVIQPDGTYDNVAYTDNFMAMYDKAYYFMLIAAYMITLLIYWIVTLIRKKKLMKEVSLSKFKPLLVVPVFIGGISLNFVISYILSVIPFPESWTNSYLESSNSLMGGSGIGLWIATVIMAPIVEEITFRGFIYSRLKTGMAKWIAIIATSFFFGLAHGTIIWGIYTFVFSLILIWVLERVKSLGVSILLHMAFNLVGTTMSAWPNLFENVSDWIFLSVSVVLAAGSGIWFFLMTRQKGEEKKRILKLHRFNGKISLLGIL